MLGLMGVEGLEWMRRMGNKDEDWREFSHTFGYLIYSFYNIF